MRARKIICTKTVLELKSANNRDIIADKGDPDSNAIWYFLKCPVIYPKGSGFRIILNIVVTISAMNVNNIQSRLDKLGQISNLHKKTRGWVQSVITNTGIYWRFQIGFPEQ